MAAKKKTTRRRSYKSARKGVRGRAIKLTAVMWLLFLLERMGILDATFWSAVMRGDVAGASSALRGAMQQNFLTASGAGVTLSAALILALVTAAMRWVAKGASIPLRGKPARLSIA